VIRRIAVSLALALLCTACGSSPASSKKQPPSFNYPRDGELRVDQIQLKATHNSYHVQNPDISNPLLAYTHAPLEKQLEHQGVRGLELDAHYDSKQGVFEVFHITLLDEGTRCRLLTDCLRTIKTWSDAHPAHHLVFIHLEPKDNPPATGTEAWFLELESEFLSVWPRDRIVTPDDVRGNVATLREAVQSRGFPTLGETRGKILIYIDNHETFRTMYTQGGKDVHGRLMFSDSSPSDPFAAISVLNDPVADQQQILDAVKQHMIVRTRVDSEGSPLPADSGPEFDAAVSAAQIVTTDFPSADENGGGYVFDLPGGKPSRCNPLTGPKDCTAEDVENPSFM